MARLITVTKVGLYDINGSYFAVDSESIRVYDQNISSIEVLFVTNFSPANFKYFL